jgi:hypothetical protein
VALAVVVALAATGMANHLTGTGPWRIVVVASSPCFPRASTERRAVNRRPIVATASALQSTNAYRAGQPHVLPASEVTCHRRGTRVHCAQLPGAVVLSVCTALLSHDGLNSGAGLSDGRVVANGDGFE